MDKARDKFDEQVIAGLTVSAFFLTLGITVTNIEHHTKASAYKTLQLEKGKERIQYLSCANGNLGRESYLVSEYILKVRINQASIVSPEGNEYDVDDCSISTQVID